MVVAVGTVCVNPRFHITDVRYNLGLTRDYPWCMVTVVLVGQAGGVKFSHLTYYRNKQTLVHAEVGMSVLAAYSSLKICGNKAAAGATR